MRLLIISHTEHYTNSDGVIVGWGATITEINHLATIFDEIYHIATHLEGDPPPSSLPYLSDNIHFVPIPFTGGVNLMDKLDIIWNAPKTINLVFKYLKKVDIFQLRAPTGIGVYFIPILTLFSRKKGWYKYAGNWNQKNPPFGYALQRWFLKKQSRKVTINGKWEDQQEHCITFENPCLTSKDLNKGNDIQKNKDFKFPYIYCFAGRLEDQKGVARIIEAFSGLSKEQKKYVKEVHLIGSGEKLKHYQDLASRSEVNFVFHAFLPQNEVFEIFKKSHFFLLPSSASEGFPKVIAEALNFGCIPIVSNVSAIGQYINNKNGYIVDPNTSEKLGSIIEEINNENNYTALNSKRNPQDIIPLFSYEYYLERIQNEIQV